MALTPGNKFRHFLGFKSLTKQEVLTKNFNSSAPITRYGKPQANSGA